MKDRYLVIKKKVDKLFAKAFNSISELELVKDPSTINPGKFIGVYDLKNKSIIEVADSDYIPYIKQAIEVYLSSKEKVSYLPGIEYEKLAEKIFNDLEDEAEITHNDKIVCKSGGTRQVDVSIRSTIVGIDILIIVQVKDLSRKVDKPVIDAFISVVKDVGAYKGIIISKKGFTGPAIEYAKKESLSLYTAHEAMHRNWGVELSIPVILRENEYDYGLSFGFPIGDDKPGTKFTLHKEPYFKIGDKVYEFSDLFHKQYLDGGLNKSGEENYINFNTENLYCNSIDQNWRKIDSLRFRYRFLMNNVYTNIFTPSEFRAFTDHIKNGINMTYINYSGLIPLIQDKSSWKKVKRKTDIVFDLTKPYIEIHSENLGFVYTFSFEIHNKDIMI